MPAGLLVALTTRGLYGGLIYFLEALNANSDKLDIEKLEAETIDDLHEKDNKNAIDELVKIIKDEFN